MEQQVLLVTTQTIPLILVQNMRHLHILRSRFVSLETLVGETPSVRTHTDAHTRAHGETLSRCLNDRQTIWSPVTQTDRVQHSLDRFFSRLPVAVDDSHRDGTVLTRSQRQRCPVHVVSGKRLVVLRSSTHRRIPWRQRTDQLRRSQVRRKRSPDRIHHFDRAVSVPLTEEPQALHLGSELGTLRRALSYATKLADLIPLTDCLPRLHALAETLEESHLRKVHTCATPSSRSIRVLIRVNVAEDTLTLIKS